MSLFAQESMAFDGVSATNRKECTMLAVLYEKNVVRI